MCRVLWKKENDLNREVEKLRADIVKAEKSMDLAAPGVSSWPRFGLLVTKILSYSLRCLSCYFCIQKFSDVIHSDHRS